MKRYLMFGNDIYYPLGGWNDFRGSFDSVSDAQDWLIKNEFNFDWMHIIDSTTGQEVYNQNAF